MNFMPAERSLRCPIRFTGARWVLVILFLAALSDSAFAQSKDRDKNKDRNDGVSETELAARLTKAEELLLKEYKEVVNEHYKQGRKENAIDVLQRMMSINPKMEGVEDQIKLINEELLQENGIKMEMDVSKGWVPICEVEEGKLTSPETSGMGPNSSAFHSAIHLNNKIYAVGGNVGVGSSNSKITSREI